MYKIFYHKRARKQLQKLPKSEQLRVNGKIRELQDDPLNPKLDIKPYLNTQNGFRLRIGKLRIIYAVVSKTKTIYIQYLGYRGDVNKHYN